MIELSPETVEKLLRRLKEAEEAVGTLAAGEVDAAVTRGGLLTPELGAAEQALRGARSELESALARSGKGPDATNGLLRQAVRAGNVGLWSWDLETDEIRTSAEWKAQLGYAEDEVGRSFEEWRSRVHPDDLAEAELRARSSIDDPRPDYRNQFRMRHRDGSWRHILARGLVERDGSGRPVRVTGTHVDVTDIEAAREAEREDSRARDAALDLLRLLFERMTLACLVLAPDGTTQEWNPAAERLFGWSRAEAIGRNAVEILVPAEARPRLEGFIARFAASRESHRGIGENLTKDGRRITCEWHDTPLHDESGRCVGILAMALDVSDRVAAEREIRAGRARLDRLLERLPVATVVVRSDGTVESFNAKAAELFGADAVASPTLEGFLGRVLPDPEELRTTSSALARLREAAAAGAPEPPLLMAIQVRDGAEIVVAADCVVVDDLAVWTATDLTEVLRLQAEGARLGRIVEESIDEVYVFDAATLRFRSENRSARENLGYSLEELRGMTPLDIKPELAAERFAGLVEPLRRGTSRGVRFETVHRRRDGSTYPVEVHVQLSAEGGDPVFVAIIQDITIRRHAEEAIRELNVELEARVSARTAELEAANRELEAFTYSVSHDLRAPLRAIDAFSQILAEEHGGRLDEIGIAHLGRVRGAAQRMGRLIDDLLRLSRIARAGLTREPVDVSALALEVLADIRAEDPGREVETVVAEGLGVVADRGLLRIALENLLRNAWKFTSRTAGARIEVGAVPSAGPPELFVRDNGAGFDMAHAGQLFTPFSRLHAPAEFSGTGIGLAIVDRVVRRHGGAIRADGVVGGGATFRFGFGGPHR